jgi:hypothetical protein
LTFRFVEPVKKNYFASDSDVTIKLKKAKAERRAHVKKKQNKEG